MQKFLIRNSRKSPQLTLVSLPELLEYLENCSDEDLRATDWWGLEEVFGGRKFTPPPPYAAFTIPDSEVEGG